MLFFFFSSRRRHTRLQGDWSSDVCSSDLFKTTPELIAYAKANPGKVGFGSSGSGSSAHLTTELMKLLTRTDMVHVPYKGAAPALADLMGGQIPDRKSVV